MTYKLPGIVLLDSRHCDGCPALDTTSYEDSYCTAEEFHMKLENIGNNPEGFGTWRTIRPKGCRLVQEDAEQDAARAATAALGRGRLDGLRREIRKRKGEQ